MKVLVIVFLALVTITVAAQDTTCTTFQTDTVACNDVPYHGCSSHSQVMNVIINSDGSFGCMHPAPQQAVLNCPGGSSCPGTYPYTVAASNPYCEETYTACGCVGAGCDGGGGGGGGGGNGDCTGDKCECDDGTCDGHCCTDVQHKIGALWRRDFSLYDGPRLSSHNACQVQSSFRPQLSLVAGNGAGDKNVNSLSPNSYVTFGATTASRTASDRLDLLREKLQ
jgi:hypothetical protein